MDAAATAQRCHGVYLPELLLSPEADRAGHRRRYRDRYRPYPGRRDLAGADRRAAASAAGGGVLRYFGWLRHFGLCRPAGKRLCIIRPKRMDRTVGKRRCRRWRGADHYYLQDVAETWMEVRSGAGASLLSHPAYLAGDDIGNECRRRGMVRLVRAHERSAEPWLEGLSFPRAEGLPPKLSASSKRNSVQSRFSSLHYRSEDITTSRAEVVIY